MASGGEPDMDQQARLPAAPGALPQLAHRATGRGSLLTDDQGGHGRHLAPVRSWAPPVRLREPTRGTA